MTVYNSAMNPNWRIEQLTDWVAKALALGDYDGQGSGRIREVPDIRTIRYYTTLGLLDRPLEMRGRTAYYGRRHLLQLVAVKRLQAQGMSLVQVQQALVGVSERKLAQVAALPPEFIERAITGKSEANEASRGTVASAPQPSATPPSPAAPRQFWAQSPKWTPPENASTTAEISPAIVLRIASGASLLLEGLAPEELTEEVIASLTPALGVLRDALSRAGLDRRKAGSAPRGAPTQQASQIPEGKDKENPA